MSKETNRSAKKISDELSEIVKRMRQYAPSLRGTGVHASDASYNRTLQDAEYLERLATALWKEGDDA